MLYLAHRLFIFISPAPGPFNIIPNSDLPVISDNLILDGTTQHGYSGLPLINTNGSYGGLIITAGNCIVKGLSINSSSNYGLTLSILGNNNILSNQISGISINSSSNNINANTIINSVGDGINISPGGKNNKIGVSVLNNIRINNGYGISISSADGNQISGNNINSNGAGGIGIVNSTALINNNKVINNTGFGLSANDAANITITSNIISANNGGGVSI